MSYSPSNTSQHSLMLVRPSTNIPWSVDVVSAVPKRLVADLPKVAASASCPGWACVTFGDGYLHVWQHKTLTTTGRNTSSSSILPMGASTMNAPTLEPPAHCLKLFFPDLIIPNDTDPYSEPPRIHLGISCSNSHTDLSVHLYALYQDWFLMRKLTPKDVATKLPMARAYTTKTRVPMEGTEQVVSLTTAPGGWVVLGTDHGTLYWVTHTMVPVALHLQKVVPPQGFLSRWWFGSNTTNTTTSSGSPQKKGSPLAAPWILPLHATEFLSLTRTIEGRSNAMGPTLTRWKVSLTVAAAHAATFEPISQVSLGFGTWREPILVEEILQVTLAANQESIHCLLRGVDQRDGGVKLYWAKVALDGSILQLHWLSRFASSEQVTVVGFVAVANGTVYAAFQHNPNFRRPSAVPEGVIVMSLLDDKDAVLQEVDLPSTQVPAILPNMFEKDTVTHGCAMIATSGIGLRVRYLPPMEPPSAKKARTSRSNPTLIPTLVSHLRSSFWQAYQDPANVAGGDDLSSNRPMAPSLKQAGGEDLEQAIVAFGVELQNKGSSAQNPMEWHKAFIKWAQQGGLYRSVSQTYRWKLLSIGQELAVFGHLQLWHRRQPKLIASCKATDIADWLLDYPVTDVAPEEWSHLLASLLDEAMIFREEMASVLYDVVADSPSQPIWLSHASMKKVLLRQLEEWKQTVKTGKAGIKRIEMAHVESVVKATLQSYSESHDSKKTYAKVKSEAIGLLRSLNGGDDELAFDLCIQYHYFEGLCQISVDHEKKMDGTTYSLDPLFGTIVGQDLLSGFTFPQFVLQWHTDAGLYGHVINYGRHSPADLTIIMKNDERLRKYRWIPAIRQRYFEQATESCLSDCQDDKTLEATQWALSMAKLSNKLLVTQNLDRQKQIDCQLELVQAQQMLEANCVSHDAVPSLLRTPEELVLMALQQLSEASTMEDRVGLATIALAVCATMKDPQASADHTAHVWAEALQLNSDDFARWLRTEGDLADPELRNRVLSTTVFGNLLRECRKNESMSSVTYGRHIEAAVVERIGGSGDPSSDGKKNPPVELSRLLRSVTASEEAVQGQSLVVASY